MNRLTWGVAVVILLVHASDAVAQQQVALAPLRPGDAVKIAVENHPFLQAADHEIEAAEADRRLARTGYLPRVDFNEKIVRSDNAVFVFGSKLLQSRFGMEDFALDALNEPAPLTNYATQLTLRQSVWNAGRTRLGARIAGHGIDAAEQSQGRTADEIAFGALRAFWGLVIAGEMLEVAREAGEAAEANLRLAVELVDAGIAIPSDRLSAQVRRAEVQAMQVHAEQDVAVAEAALLQALGLEDAGPIELAAPEGIAEAGDSFEERLEAAVAERADLRSLESRVRQAELGQKLARRHNLADLGVMASYEWNGDALFAADGRNWAAGLGLSVSVFDGRETAARVARSRADTSRLQSLRAALLQRIRLEVRTAWAEFESAKGQFDAASTAFDSSREALRIVRDRYEEGLALIVELLAAEAAHTRAQAELVASRGRVWLARAGLDLASGYRLSSRANTTGGE